MSWKLVYAQKAWHDWKHLRRNGRDVIQVRIKTLLSKLEQDPWHNPPPFKRLQGEFQGLVSRRINLQHRLIYQVLEAEKTIRVESLWGHFT